jgi:hypothetical protein
MLHPHFQPIKWRARMEAPLFGPRIWPCNTLRRSSASLLAGQRGSTFSPAQHNAGPSMPERHQLLDEPLCRHVLEEHCDRTRRRPVHQRTCHHSDCEWWSTVSLTLSFEVTTSGQLCKDELDFVVEIEQAATKSSQIIDIKKVELRCWYRRWLKAENAKVLPRIVLERRR